MSRRLWLDTHIHVSATNSDGSHRDNLVKDLLAMLDGDGDDLRLVISPDGAEMARVKTDPDGQLDGARFIKSVVDGAPGRVLGACMVNPNYFDEANRTMDLCFGEWGFVLLGEMLQYMMDYKMNSDPVEKLVRRAANEFGVPVQVHISTSLPFRDNAGWGMEHLEDLLGLAQRVPEANYILAHFVGMPDDPPVVDQYLDRLDQEFSTWPDNFYAEIRDFNSPGVRSLLARVPHNRIIAGTDWVTRVGPPFLPYGCIFGVKTEDENPYPPRVATMVKFLREAGASEETIDLIGSRNALELLPLG
ncbi:MAG: amidohydrolase family protein [Armatimonadia bacterium]